MRSTPGSSPDSVRVTCAGYPPRASTHCRISSWSVVVFADAITTSDGRLCRKCSRLSRDYRDGTISVTSDVSLFVSDANAQNETPDDNERMRMRTGSAACELGSNESCAYPGASTAGGCSCT